MKKITDPARALRAHAEQQVAQRADATPPGDAAAQALAHELKVHQVELEIQNEELHRAQAETQAALARYTELYDFAPACYLTLDARGYIQQINLAGARLLGKERRHLLGLGLGGFVAESYRIVFQNFLAQAFLASAEAVSELALRRGDQPQQLCFVHATVQLSVSGQVAHVVLVDITEKKQAEETLREYRLLFENSMDGVLLTRPGGQILAANPAAQRMFERSEAELRQSGRNDVMDLSDPRLPAALAERSASGHFSGELMMLRKSGARFPAEISSAVFLDRNGLNMVSLIMRDISARKQAELQLSKLSRAVEQSPNGIVITNLDGAIEYVNDAFVSASGYGRDQLIGRNPRLLGSGKTPPATYAGLWARLKEGQVWRGSFFNRRQDGSEYVEFAVVAPIRQADGSISHYVSVKEDVTEKIRMAGELDQHRHHLEQLVDERTLELNEARRQAEAANIAKSTFLSNMSHEIRTPMNAILGFTHVLRRSNPTPQQSAHLDRILGASTHLLSLINDVLDLSKIEAGRLVLERADFSVREILDQVCTLVDESARAKGLSVTMEWEDGPLWLLGDPTRVRQALLNLAANAVKFTSAGGIRLIARRLPDPGPEILMRFEVQDSGIGIDAGMLHELFRPFVQGDDSTTRKYGGTGLGLAITKQLVNLMGGEVGVESQPGIGSRFWFSARFAPGRAGPPVAAATAATTVSAAVTSTATANAADMAEAALRRSHAGARLLLVDDDMINQEVVLVILEDSGLKVDRADDGAQALAMAAATHYDLILMDMQMPVLDGLAATEAIRRLPAHAQTPILAMTANAFDDDRQRCLAAGMNEHLAKPVVPQVLYEALLRWLPGHAAATTVATESAAPLAPPANRGQAHTALQHVAALLAADDPRAEQALREHLPLLRACLDAEILFLLERQVQAFDYPQALQTARAAQQLLA